KYETPIPNHTAGIEIIINLLLDKEVGVINSLSEIKAAGHRVAHGGEHFKNSVLINNDTLTEISNCIQLAPLHNPANLKGILAVEKLIPGLPQVAVFDTSFHQSMPDYAYIYGIPYEYYENFEIRRYGFHGTSHKFVAEKAANMIGKNINDLKIISCHLGNGASITAIDRGVSIDNSMGFTPVEGLIMGTRCGDLDVGALLFIMEKENLDTKQANDLVNKKSGVLGISGISSDMRDLENAAMQGNERAKLALDVYAYKVKKYIGSYIAAMNGLDLLIFTGGIGENSMYIREQITSNMEYLGIKIDKNINDSTKGVDAIISTEDSKVCTIVATTNEELVIARDTMRIVDNLK
ncbi:MAG TPA: acetate kinase, partial [Bacteroidales bacterium]|nr:acetate kinase [Bacteroidales bacterium]